MANPEFDPSKGLDNEIVETPQPPATRQLGPTPTADTKEGELGETGKITRKRTELILEKPEIAAERIMLIRTAPLFEGLRDETIIHKLSPKIRFFDAQRAGRVLFDATNPDDGLGRARNIIITGKTTKIKVAHPSGKTVTEETEIPEHTAMGEQGFLGLSRTATVTSLTEGATFWRLDGPIESLGLTEKEQLILRANLLSARGGEIKALNQEISMESRTSVEPFPNLKAAMADIVETLGGVSDIRAEHINVIPGHFFYLESGTLQAVDSTGRVLGLVRGPNIVQELIGAGLSKQTAQLKPVGVVKGMHVPCRTLIENEHPQAQNMLALAEAAFNSKMVTGNQSVAESRPEPSHFSRALAWAQSLFGSN